MCVCECIQFYEHFQWQWRWFLVVDTCALRQAVNTRHTSKAASALDPDVDEKEMPFDAFNSIAFKRNNVWHVKMLVCVCACTRAE